MARKTFAVSLNDRNPDEAALWRKLDAANSESELIKRALLAYFEGGNTAPAITEQEVSEMRARLAWYEQQATAPVAAPQAPAPTEGGGAVGMFGGQPLSESFKAAVAKAARPGLRLESL